LWLFRAISPHKGAAEYDRQKSQDWEAYCKKVKAGFFAWRFAFQAASGDNIIVHLYALGMLCEGVVEGGEFGKLKRRVGELVCA